METTENLLIGHMNQANLQAKYLLLVATMGNCNKVNYLFNITHYVFQIFLHQIL